MGCASSRQRKPLPHVSPVYPAPDVSVPPAPSHTFPLYPSDPSYVEGSVPRYRVDVSTPMEDNVPRGYLPSYDSHALPPNDYIVLNKLTRVRKPLHAPARSDGFITTHEPQAFIFAKSPNDFRVIGRTAGGGPTAPNPGV